MNGVLCRDCGKDHETVHDAYLCDLRMRNNHIADCACDICTRVMAYEDALFLANESAERRQTSEGGVT